MFGLIWVGLSPAAAADRPTIVFAAVSLKTALDGAAAEWKAKTGRLPLVVYAGSSALAKQIENGAPADLFLSANLRWMDYLEQKGLIDRQSRRELFGNRLVLIAPRQSQLKLKLSPELDLVAALGDSRLAVANIVAVPAGLYAAQALKHFGLWRQVVPRLVETQHVRAALALVVRREAALGIVYATDANAERGVRVVDTFPETSHDPIVYPAALVHPGKSTDALAFLNFLASDAGLQFFLKQGFTRLQ